MKQWQSIFLTITISVCLVAGSISIAFKLLPIISSQVALTKDMQTVGQALNQMNQRIEKLEQGKK